MFGFLSLEFEDLLALAAGFHFMLSHDDSRYSRLTAGLWFLTPVIPKEVAIESLWGNSGAEEIGFLVFSDRFRILTVLSILSIFSDRWGSALGYAIYNWVLNTRPRYNRLIQTLFFIYKFHLETILDLGITIWTFFNADWLVVNLFVRFDCKGRWACWYLATWRFQIDCEVHLNYVTITFYSPPYVRILELYFKLISVVS